MSQKIDEKIKQIQEKLLLLSKQSAAVQKENDLLKASLEEAKLLYAQASNTAAQMQQQLDIAKYANTDMTVEERKSFEKKINTYIKEIDKCIALLSN